MVYLLLLLNVVWGASQLSVFKLIQYQTEGSYIGSHVSALNFLGAHHANLDEIPRKVTLVALSELSPSVWSGILAKKPSGVLIIIDTKTSSTWSEMENVLGSTGYQFPIYFTYKTDEALEVYHTLKHLSTGTSDDQFQFQVSTDEKVAIKELEQENFYGFIYDYNENLPTLAIVTYYDAFSVVPELATGADINASGLVVFLEIARIFSNLFDKGLPGYNLLMLATSAGAFNFQGLRSWLESEDADLQSIQGNIAFALCLDTLGKEDSLKMHISRFHKEGETEAIQFYNSVNSTAKLSETPLGYVKKKVNMADPFIPWAHEQFARKKVVAATLSHLESAPTGILERSSLFDEANTLDLKQLEKNIRFAAETILKYLYKSDSLKLFNTPDLTNRTIISDWVNKITNFTRFPTHLTPTSEFNKFLSDELQAFTNSTFKTQKFKIADFFLYPSKKEIMNVYRVKPAILDFYIFLAILAYIALLWGALKVCGELKFKKLKSS